MRFTNDHSANPRFLRRCSELSAISLFIFAPVVQIISTRSLPIFVGLSLFFLFAGHLGTGWKYFIENTLDYKTAASLPRIPLIAALGLFVWFMISMQWSPDVTKAIKDVASLTLLAPVAFFIARQLRCISVDKIAWFAATGFLLTCFLLVFELNDLSRLRQLLNPSNQLFDLNRNAVLLVCVTWPLIFLCKFTGHHILAAGVFIGCFFVMVFSKSQSAQLMFLVSVISAIGLRFVPWASRMILSGVAVVIIIFPFVMASIGDVHGNSNYAFLAQGHPEHRLVIWKGYADLVLARPITGYGPRADRALGKDGRAGHHAVAAGYSNVISHPHNISLEVWINLGGIGAGLMALFLLGLATHTQRLPNARQFAAMQLLLASSVYMMVGASWVQGWWQASVLMGLVLLLIPNTETTPNPVGKTPLTI